MHDGGGDATGEDRAARPVAERAAGHPEWEGSVVGRDGGRDARSRPERQRVVAALVGFLAEGTLAVACGVDDVRVVGADVLHIDLHSLCVRVRESKRVECDKWSSI